MFARSSCLLLFLLLPVFFFGSVRVQKVTTAATKPVFNSTAYHAVCSAPNFQLEQVCGLPKDFAKVLGGNLDTHYLAKKLMSDGVVGEIASQCSAGTECVKAWDQMTVDRLKIEWRDSPQRRRMCQLRPCLEAMLKEKVPAACNNTARLQNFRAFNLVCALADKFEPTDDLMTCVDAAIELYQYTAADVLRGKKTTEDVCDCTKNYAKTCPESCKPLIKMFVCLSTRCSIDSATYFDKFPEWAWYFKKETELRNRYNVGKCNEEVIESPRIVVAVVNFYGLQNAIIAICISLVIASVLATGFFICYRRAAISRLSSRNRCEYTEMKEEL